MKRLALMTRRGFAAGPAPELGGAGSPGAGIRGPPRGDPALAQAAWNGTIWIVAGSRVPNSVGRHRGSRLLPRLGKRGGWSVGTRGPGSYARSEERASG